MTHDQILAHLRGRLGPDDFTTSQFRDNHRVIVVPTRLLELLRALKEGCGFDMLIDVAGIDYLRYPNARDRFGVVYSLLNTATGVRLYVKTHLNEPDLTLPSVFSL